MLEGIVFSFATVALIYISRASLLVPKSHGFYRFFAWELMLVLIVLNIDGWYNVPLTFDQTCQRYSDGRLAVAGHYKLRHPASVRAAG